MESKLDCYFFQIANKKCADQTALLLFACNKVSVCIEAQIGVYNEKLFSFFSTITCYMGTQQELIETFSETVL